MGEISKGASPQGRAAGGQGRWHTPTEWLPPAGLGAVLLWILAATAPRPGHHEPWSAGEETEAPALISSSQSRAEMPPGSSSDGEQAAWGSVPSGVKVLRAKKWKPPKCP